MATKNRLQTLLRSEIAGYLDPVVQDLKAHFLSKNEFKLEMVNYIGPIFEELKGDIKGLRSDVGVLKTDVGVLKADVGSLKSDVGTLNVDVGGLKVGMGGLKGEIAGLKTQIHGQTILMEQMDRKIDTALEASSSVLNYENEMRQLNHRVGHLEADVNVIKLVLKNNKP